jgi:hypothetical protein
MGKRVSDLKTKVSRDEVAMGIMWHSLGELFSPEELYQKAFIELKYKDYKYVGFIKRDEHVDTTWITGWLSVDSSRTYSVNIRLDCIRMEGGPGFYMELDSGEEFARVVKYFTFQDWDTDNWKSACGMAGLYPMQVDLYGAHDADLYKIESFILELHNDCEEQDFEYLDITRE